MKYQKLNYWNKGLVFILKMVVWITKRLAGVARNEQAGAQAETSTDHEERTRAFS